MSETHIPAHPVIPVDTNGAGDAHVGAFIAALARGEAPDRALRIANTAAALSTLLPGPATCPTLSATLAAMSEGGPP
jgi:sugar/nucleoside kinase (ribokinase family)